MQTDHAMERRVTAVLGPTNTGKTHLALERMMGHASGMIGFPLRLLARENYDRVVQKKGPAAVALITGEERIHPPTARYFICTVESMPVTRLVEFLAVDEVQLIADGERGHIFTDRVLRARGMSETMLLGSDTVAPILRALIPGLEVVQRPRFSTLSFAGSKKLSRLPRRSAVVAFSAAEVYEIAELMRRSRGGCAVVMGALSPRARNAQVALYQSGEVDFLVATDAIGMGLNMSLDHVAFARLTKFDGRGPRRLTAAEVAQIAGRAGRHQNDGTFGTTPEAGQLDAEIVEQVEAHSFPPVTEIFWRSAELDFRSVPALLRSLDQPPPLRFLHRKRDAEDHRVLSLLARQEEVTARAQGRTAVSLLWEACQIPDFRKTLSDTHLGLIKQIFLHLTGPSGRLPADWVAGALARLDRTDGDIDTLSARLAHVRTWTYVSHRPDWLPTADRFAAQAREIEDKLSDALHERLTQRFVDRRGAFLIRRLADQAELLAGVAADGAVVVEGHPVGRLAGFQFEPDIVGDREAARPLLAAARRTLGPEIARRVAALLSTPDEGVRLLPDGTLVWCQGEDRWPVARLLAGPSPLAPRVQPIPADLMRPTDAERVQRHLTGWVRRLIDGWCGDLREIAAARLGGVARGVAHQLVEALGTLDVAAAGPMEMEAADRAALSRLDVRFGREVIYVASQLSAEAVALKSLLAAVWLDIAPPLPPEAIVVRRDPALPEAWYRLVGYRCVGPMAMRVDRLEALAQAVRQDAKTAAEQAGEATSDPARLAGLAGCEIAEVPAVLAALGYRPRRGEGTGRLVRRRSRTATAPANPDSPFAALAGLRMPGLRAR